MVDIAHVLNYCLPIERQPIESVH